MTLGDIIREVAASVPLPSPEYIAAYTRWVKIQMRVFSDQHEADTAYMELSEEERCVLCSEHSPDTVRAYERWAAWSLKLGDDSVAWDILSSEDQDLLDNSLPEDEPDGEYVWLGPIQQQEMLARFGELARENQILDSNLFVEGGWRDVGPTTLPAVNWRPSYIRTPKDEASDG